MRKKIRLGLGLLLTAAVVAAAAGCGGNQTWVNSKSDQTACVYDGAPHHGQTLILQIPAGGHSKQVDNRDEIVYIPTSNRFFMASTDGNVRDPLAPEFYKGHARGGVAIDVQGQIRFRFNAAKACDWYAKHGRRNLGDRSDLGFNVRGAAQADTGWARFLAENFGVTMQSVVSAESNSYDWQKLVYNFPENADTNGNLPKSAKTKGTPEQIAYGVALGKVFTQYLKANLGDNYFCGVDTDLTGQGDDATCPPMYFEVTDISTEDPSLMKSREQTQALAQQLANEQQQATIQQQHASSLINSAKQKEQLLEAQAANAEMQAEIDNAKCIALAKVGDSCDGTRPAPIVGAAPSGK